MARTVDHVTFAGSDLDVVQREFSVAGFDPEYGGTHSNGVTHMALVGFEDRSYIELVSKIDPRATSPWWDEQIDADLGACAWAIRVDDIADESARLANGNFAVDGPREYSRERPDGGHVEWELTRVGEGPYGAQYPMLIMDHTPLDHRATVTTDAATSGLAGLDTVVVGTPRAAFERYVRGYEVLFETERTTTREYPGLGVTAAHFADAPVAVAMPASEDSWLAARVNQYGTLPCMFLLEGDDIEMARTQFKIADVTDWAGDAVYWLDVDIGGRLGIVAIE